MRNIYKLVRVHRDTKGATKYVEEAVSRIAAMSERHGGDAVWLSQHVWNLFAQRSHLLGLWVRVDAKTDEIVGHLIATIQQWDGENVAWIHQAENEGSTMDQAAWNLGLFELKRWVEEVNAALPAGTEKVKRMLFSTPHDPRFFERRVGFKVYRHLLERRI